MYIYMHIYTHMRTYILLYVAYVHITHIYVIRESRRILLLCHQVRRSEPSAITWGVRSQTIRGLVGQGSGFGDYCRGFGSEGEGPFG